MGAILSTTQDSTSRDTVSLEVIHHLRKWGTDGIGGLISETRFRKWNPEFLMLESGVTIGGSSNDE